MTISKFYSAVWACGDPQVCTYGRMQACATSAGMASTLRIGNATGSSPLIVNRTRCRTALAVPRPGEPAILGTPALTNYWSLWRLERRCTSRTSSRPDVPEPHLRAMLMDAAVPRPHAAGPGASYKLFVDYAGRTVENRAGVRGRARPLESHLRACSSHPTHGRLGGVPRSVFEFLCSVLAWVVSDYLKGFCVASVADRWSTRPYSQCLKHYNTAPGRSCSNRSL